MNGNIDKGEKEPAFDADRAEFFEAIGHPVRIKILQVLGQKRIGFAELKKETGIDSSGHLSFHLTKLSRMVALGQDGLYGLTSEGYNALKMVEAVTRSGGDEGKNLAVRAPGRPGTRLRVLLIALVIGLVALAGFAAYQQVQINSVSGKLQSTVTITSIVSLSTVTSTATVTSVQSGTGQATGGTEMTNGTVRVAFLDSGVASNTAWYNVRNDGDSPLYISFIYVNGTPAFFNGTSGVTLAVNNNPIPPGQTATVSAIYPVGTGFSAPGTITFTLVSGQGLEVSDSILLIGGISTTTTTSTS